MPVVEQAPMESLDFQVHAPQSVLWSEEELDRSNASVSDSSILDSIYRSQRINGETYKPVPSAIFTEDDPRIGAVRLRFDWGTQQPLEPKDEVRFVRALFGYARIDMQIQDLLRRQAKHADVVRAVRRRYPGLRGGELAKLSRTVTDVTSVGLSPDAEKIRAKLGDSLPEVGFERVSASVLVKGDITGEDVIRVLKLGLQFLGVEVDEAMSTQALTFKKDMKVTDRDKLIALANSGTLPIGYLHPEPEDKLKVEEIKERKPRLRKPKPESTS